MAFSGAANQHCSIQKACIDRQGSHRARHVIAHAKLRFHDSLLPTLVAHRMGMIAEGRDVACCASTKTKKGGPKWTALFYYRKRKLVVVITTMQRRTIIVGRLAIFIRLVRRTTQRRLARVLVVDDFATILQSRQSRLHLIEFRSGNYVFILLRQNSGDLLLRMLNAIRSRRMRSKGLRQRARLFLFRSLDLFEEVDHRLRIVAAGIEILGSQIVGLRLESTREFHEGERNADTGSFVRRITDSTADKDQRDGGKVRPISARHLAHG